MLKLPVPLSLCGLLGVLFILSAVEITLWLVTVWNLDPTFPEVLGRVWFEFVELKA